jgi:hypothetical protein
MNSRGNFQDVLSLKKKEACEKCYVAKVMCPSMSGAILFFVRRGGRGGIVNPGFDLTQR